MWGVRVGGKKGGEKKNMLQPEPSSPDISGMSRRVSQGRSALVNKEPACQGKRCKVQSLSQEDPLEESMATHCSNLAWKIPWTEEPGGLQSMGSLRVAYAPSLTDSSAHP